MDRKEIELSDSEGSSINVITGNMYSGTPSSIGPRLITIFHDNEVARAEVPEVSIPVLVVEVPKPFPCKSQKVIPWDYNCNYTHQITVNDLTGVRGITRSGRCYALDMIEKIVSEKLLIPTNKEQPSKEKEQSSIEKKGNKTLESTSKPVTEKEISEFLSSSNTVNTVLLNS